MGPSTLDFWPLVQQIAYAILPLVGSIVLAVVGFLGYELRLHVKNERVLNLLSIGVHNAEQTMSGAPGSAKKAAVLAFAAKVGVKSPILSEMIESIVNVLPQALTTLAAALPAPTTASSTDGAAVVVVQTPPAASPTQTPAPTAEQTTPAGVIVPANVSAPAPAVIVSGSTAPAAPGIDLAAAREAVDKLTEVLRAAGGDGKPNPFV